MTTRIRIVGTSNEAESDPYGGILGVTEARNVSSDIIPDPRAPIVDLEMTRVADGHLGNGGTTNLEETP